MSPQVTFIHPEETLTIHDRTDETRHYHPHISTQTTLTRGERGRGVRPQQLRIYLFGVLRRFQHCTGHITTGSWKGRGNSTYSSSGFCTVNCQPTASNYQLFHLRPCRERTPASEVGGESVTTLPPWPHSN